MGNLATPKSVQKLQTALHAKAKAQAGYRFYTLYDKISRDDSLAHEFPPNWWTPLLSSDGSGKVSNGPGTASFYG